MSEKTSQKRKSERKRPPHIGSVEENIRNFTDHKDVEFRIKCAEKMASLRGLVPLLISGNMFVESATDKSLNILEKQELIEKGKERLERVYSLGRSGNQGLGSVAGEAALRLARLPATTWIVAGNRIPPIEKASTDYERLLESGEELLYGWSNSSDPKIRGRLGETVAQAGIIALVSRYALRYCKDDLTAIPSFLSEQRADSRGSSQKKSWSVSIFSQDEEVKGPFLEDKVLVRTQGRNRNHTTSIHPSVSPVYVRSDLSLSNWDIGIDTVLSECLAEQTEISTGSTSSVLDRRTELLRDLI